MTHPDITDSEIAIFRELANPERVNLKRSPPALQKEPDAFLDLPVPDENIVHDVPPFDEDLGRFNAPSFPHRSADMPDILNMTDAPATGPASFPHLDGLAAPPPPPSLLDEARVPDFGIDAPPAPLEDELDLENHTLPEGFLGSLEPTSRQGKEPTYISSIPGSARGPRIHDRPPSSRQHSQASRRNVPYDPFGPPSVTAPSHAHPMPCPPADYEATDLDVDKASLLHEIRQLQMLNPSTAIVPRELSINDSYETLQLALFQAKQSVDIASGVNTMKDFLKIGCTGIELGASKFGRGMVDLQGWSSEIANDIGGQSYNTPLQQIYRRYWRAGGQGMNPFVQLLLLLVGSAAVFAIKRKFLGGGGGPSMEAPTQAPPMPSVPTSFESQPMPMNRPKMRRPSTAPAMDGVPTMSSTAKPSAGETTGPTIDFSDVSEPTPVAPMFPSFPTSTPGKMPPINAQALQQSMNAMMPMMNSMMPVIMNSMIGARG